MTVPSFVAAVASSSASTAASASRRCRPFWVGTVRHLSPSAEGTRAMTTLTTTTTMIMMQRPAVAAATSMMTTTTMLVSASPLSWSGPAGVTPSFRRCSSSSSEATVNQSLSSPKLQSLYDRIAQLPEAEVNVLGALVLQVLGRTIFPGEFGGSGGGAAMDAANADIAAAEAAAASVRTTFDLKLVGFDSKAKIKVIKEVRAIAGLGLKEAKELVEAAPKIIQKDLKQDKIDELKAQLEAAGAIVEVV